MIEYCASSEIFKGSLDSQGGFFVSFLHGFQRKIWGRKRHLLVDTLGLLLAVKVHTAGLVDRRGAPLLLQDLQGRFPRLRHLFADSGYTGPLIDWIKAHLGWDTEIVPKAESKEQHKWVLIDGKPVRLPKPKGGFQVQRHRWKVDITQSHYPGMVFSVSECLPLCYPFLIRLYDIFIRGLLQVAYQSSGGGNLPQ
jgi:transposase